MLKNYPSQFIFIIKLLDLLKGNYVRLLDSEQDDKKRRESLNKEIDTFARLENDLINTDMAVSAEFCKRAKQTLTDSCQKNSSIVDMKTLSKFDRQLEILNDVILEEISSRDFLYVPHPMVSYYESNQFPREIIDRFNDSIYDMEEAGKCFALGRSTACAFHLLRVIEVGMKELKKFLKIKKNTPTWDSAIKIVEKHIKELDQKSDRKTIAKLKEIVSRTYAIKDAWRNKTMHVETKYNPEEAREVFEASKNYMKVLYSLIN